MATNKRITNYKEFYQFYLTEHKKPLTRIFHFVGILLVFLVIFYVLKSGKERFLWYCPIFGYGLAWFSHAVIKKQASDFQISIVVNYFRF